MKSPHANLKYIHPFGRKESVIFVAREEDCLPTLLILKACWRMKLTKGKALWGLGSQLSFTHMFAAVGRKISHPPLTALKSIGKACGFRFHALCN